MVIAMQYIVDICIEKYRVNIDIDENAKWSLQNSTLL